MAVPEEDGIRRLLGIPDGWALAAVMPLGSPVRQVTRLKRASVPDFVVLENFRWNFVAHRTRIDSVGRLRGGLGAETEVRGP